VDNKDIKAVVLAAGKGTRMKSMYPKVLHKIFGKSLIERVLNAVTNRHIDEVFVIVGHQSELVKEHINQNCNKNVKCILQQPQLGTGHAVFQVFNELIHFDGTLMVVCGDTPLLKEETLSQFLETHLASASDLSILSAQLQNPTAYGRVLRGMEGTVIKIVEEKDATPEEKKIKEINTGVYCLNWKKISPAFLELNTNNAQGEYYLTDIVEWATNKELTVNAHQLAIEDEIFGINSQADLAEATRKLNNRKLDELYTSGVSIVDPQNTWISPETQIESDTTILPGCYIEGDNYISTGCKIGPHVYIQGNVELGPNNTVIMSDLSDIKTGPNCTIGPFARLRDNVELGKKVRIGNFVELKNTSIQDNSNAAHLAYIGDAELGSGVNIGAGTITANYNALTRQKSKTIIQNKVKVGSNCVLVAPISIGDSANIAAGSVITKDVPANALAIARERQAIINNWVTKKLNKLNKNDLQLEESKRGS
jgi:bifunctional UDP-N-acetylglucosamine pyrophosphorylase / glucosamine-1-phosphate N-acetyltransferase